MRETDPNGGEQIADSHKRYYFLPITSEIRFVSFRERKRQRQRNETNETKRKEILQRRRGVVTAPQLWSNCAAMLGMKLTVKFLSGGRRSSTLDYGRRSLTWNYDVVV